MSEKKSINFKLPPSWVDRIFLHLEEIFGDRFTLKSKAKHIKEIERERWSTGLYGVTADEIKKVLNLCLHNKITSPPNVIEFYHYAKNWKTPAEQKPITRASVDVQSHHMQIIRNKLHGQVSSNTTVPD